ncbi:MAG: MBL fold metallo-hydrolase [Clostridia bacterium]|nr:MBL fold metallo-hydrolase [Clostridia bacterium]
MKKTAKLAAMMIAVVLALSTMLASCAPGGTGTDGNGKENDRNMVDPENSGPTAEPLPTPVNGVKAADGCVEIYQLAPESKSLMMSYVIKTGEGKICVIDGGIDGQGLDAKPYLPSAIRAILGLGQNDYFEVEAWFLTHHHKDHFFELAKMLRDYKESDNYVINNFYFAFPDIGVEWKSLAGDKDHDLEHGKILYEAFDHYYSIVPFKGIAGADIPESSWQKPEGAEYYYYKLINGCVINDENVDREGGLSINVDGLSFDILQKWNKTCQNVNSTSTVIKLSACSHGFLFLGDSYTDNATKLSKKYASNPEVLSDCEYIQMGHHGQNGPDRRFYNNVNAKDMIRLWPTPDWVWNVDKSGPYNTYQTRKWVGLPEDYRDFESGGYGETGRDIVTGLYKAFPADPAKVADWTPEVLAAQRVARFD